MKILFAVLCGLALGAGGMFAWTWWYFKDVFR